MATYARPNAIVNRPIRKTWNQDAEYIGLTHTQNEYNEPLLEETISPITVQTLPLTNIRVLDRAGIRQDAGRTFRSESVLRLNDLIRWDGDRWLIKSVTPWPTFYEALTERQDD